MRCIPSFVVLLVATPALAQEATPVLQPTRDVEVVYSVTHGAQQVRERFRWQANTGRQRVDSPVGSNYTLADRKAGTLSIVNTAARKIVQITLPPGPLNGGPASFHRVGQQSIAGVPCTDYQVVTPQNATAAAPIMVVCLTSDGVTLGMKTGDTQAARAISVLYTAADPAAFTLPTNYALVAPKEVARTPR